MSTWAHIVCEDRPDIHKENLRLTEHLIVKHIDWRIWPIADAQTIAAWIEHIEEEADASYLRYSKYLPVLDCDEYDEGEFAEQGSQSPPDF